MTDFGKINMQQFQWNFDHFVTGTIEAMDIDFCLESRGQYLVIEFKENPNASDRKPLGQYLTFLRLHQQGIATIAYVYGKSNNPTKVQVLNRKGAFEYNNIDIHFLQKLIHEWYQWTLTLPKPQFIRPDEIVFKKMT